MAKDTSKPLGPMEALTAIRKLAQVALEAESPGLHEPTLRSILQACDNALPSRRKAPRSASKP